MEAEEYVPKMLGALQEIQQTGDMFFPGSWLSAGLAGHTSKNVYTMVNSFLEKHSNYPQNLKLKILANSDHLRRLHSEEENKDRLTNASAESFNAKIKAFRSQLRGVSDVKFFMFRLAMLYA